MDKVNLFFHNLSLRKSIVVYIAVFAFIGTLSAALTASSCNIIKTRIQASYPVSEEKYYLTTVDGARLGDGAYIGTEPVPLSERDKKLLQVLELLPIIAVPVYSVLCVMAAAFLFYRNKLKKPLDELRAASEKISNNDLSFTIKYDSRDELGRLCASYEIMRATLAGNFAEMWRQVDGRRQLNAAFAHDLRTPLTVLKGYNEILRSNTDTHVRNTAATMEKHLSRMEAYVSSMSSLQRLEDARPECKAVLLQPFLSSLYESAEIVCRQGGKQLCRQSNAAVKLSAQRLSIDTDFVSQVCNNLIANAARYADTTVTLTVRFLNDSLTLSVSDDGKGFGKDILDKASNPYFTEETDRSGHFGLGLYICKILCEHHGGFLQLENLPKGAKVTAFFKFLT